MKSDVNAMAKIECKTFSNACVTDARMVDVRAHDTGEDWVGICVGHCGGLCGDLLFVRCADGRIM